MRSRTLMAAGLLLALAVTCAQAANWRALGPDGGDVRSLAYDPQNPDRLFLGTSSGKLFVSNDKGATWSRYAQLGSGDDLVLDHIVFDPSHPKTIYVAAWSVENNDRGELFRSNDGGTTWEIVEPMHGKSIRAFAIAASNPKMMVAGALDGVYRSDDAGKTWRRTTPANHPELKNFESVAIDPKDPETIYAGTWHLPWKTTNGGATWANIKKGIIDDSDVFSIIIDPQQPSVVYASACSGIYKSETAGEVFRKIQGIPFSARRTRVLKQDPNNSDVVYAGTTEGLWKTVDAGKTWKRVSAGNIIVNDVFVDPRRSARVLLATDRSGVLASDDGGLTFAASNRGFAHRQVAALLVDKSNSETVYAGLLNDKEFGGIFRSKDSGRTWSQLNDGLGARDIFTLRQAQDGTLLAGTNNGIFLLAAMGTTWRPANTVVTEKFVTIKKQGGFKAHTVKQKVVGELRARVASLDASGSKWFAATSAGLFSSPDKGQTWFGGAVLGNQNFISVAVRGNTVAAAGPRAIVVSLDGGSTWYAAKVPPFVTQIAGISLDGDSHLWLASREGAFRSDNGGDAWDHVMQGIPPHRVHSIFYDEEGQRLLATAEGRSFESRDGGRTWHSFGEMGYPVRSLGLGWGRVFAATNFDGVIAPAEAGEHVERGNIGAGGSSQ